MAGEMIQADLEVGGEWWGAGQDLLAVAHSGGFDQSYLQPFDQYQGPQCVLKRNGMVVGSLWLQEKGFLVRVENGRRFECKEISGIDDSKAFYDFVKEVWYDWNMGYNPEEVKDEQVVEKKDDRLIINEDGQINTFIKCQVGDELTSIVENFHKRMISYKYRYYVLED
jgi:hypothetical protein